MQHAVSNTSHQSERVVAATQRSTLDGVLDQLREMPPGPVVVTLDPLSVVFSTPDHFRALDGVRIARSLAVTLAVNDPHRTGLALAFGYRVRPLTDQPAPQRRGTPSPALPPPSRNGTYALDAEIEQEIPTDAWDESDTGSTRRTVPSRLWGMTIIVALVLAAVSLGGAALVWRVHTADVTITPAEQSFSRVVPFAVSVVPTDDPNAIQTTVFTTTIAREGDAPATGKATVPDGTAAGAMTFRSRADGATTVKAGTALKGSRDVMYTLLADVIVPGLDFGRGQLGEATARVRATQPGPGGNLAAGFSVRYTDNLTYISGDISGGTEKQVAVVTDDDIALVRGRLESDLRTRALTEVNAALPTGVTALNDFLMLQTPTMTAQPSAGTQADSAHIHVALTAQLPIYRDSDFNALIDRRLGEAIHEAGGGGDGPRAVLSTSVVKSKPVFVDVQGPLVRYFASVTGMTRSIVTDADMQQLRSAITGKDAASAGKLLARNTGIGQVRIAYGPAWLPSPLRERMPRTVAHIRIHLNTPA